MWIFRNVWEYSKNKFYSFFFPHEVVILKTETYNNITKYKLLDIFSCILQDIDKAVIWWNQFQETSVKIWPHEFKEIFQPFAPLYCFGSDIQIVLISMLCKDESLMGQDQGCSPCNPVSLIPVNKCVLFVFLAVNGFVLSSKNLDHLHWMACIFLPCWFAFK